MPFRVAFRIAPAAFALLAFLGAPLSAAETPATFPSGSASVLIGGSFTALGEARLALLALDTGAYHGVPVQVSGVRATLIRGRTCYIAGDFTNVNGQPRAGLARLDLDGRLDADWHPPVEGSVAVMAAAGDFLYLGGSFTAVDGQPRANIARIALADGRVDAWGCETDGAVHAIAATRSTVVIGGAFSSVAGEPHVRLARLSVEVGTPDPAFTAGADSDVRTLAIRDERLYLGGQFSRINAEDRVGLAKVDLATGSVDPDWRADVDGAVLAISAAWDKLYVGGAFTAVANAPRSNCARLALASGAAEPWTADTDGQVTSIAEVDGGRILLGGRFTSIAGVPAAGLAAVAGADGRPESSWLPPSLPEGESPASLALAGNTVCVAASSVQGKGGSGLAWLNADGSLDAQGTPLDGTRPRVLCAVAHRGKAYLGGDFTMVDGQPRIGLARVDLASGRVDRDWRCDANGPVRTLALTGDTLLVGGDFTRLGTATRSHLGQLGLADAAILPLQTEMDGTVFAVLPTPQGLLIAGNFTRVGTLQRHGLARLQGADAAVDPGFTADLSDNSGPGTAHALQQLDPQRIAVGGRFTGVNGAEAGNLAIIQVASGATTPWSPADGPVFALALGSGRLAVGGGFGSIAGAPRARIAQLDPQTGTPTAWRSDADAEVRSLAVVRGELWLAGDFSACGGQAAMHLARRAWSDAKPLPVIGSDARIDLVFALPAPPAP